jgi:hypothetical protein
MAYHYPTKIEKRKERVLKAWVLAHAVCFGGLVLALVVVLV